MIKLGNITLKPHGIQKAFVGLALVYQAAKEVIVSGASPLTIIKAVAGKLKSLTQYGKCEQDGTPTPSNPVPIKCNNGTIGIVDDELPSGYTRLQYIHFDRASYFDSGIVPNTYDYEIETKCSFDSASSTPICAWGFMGSQSSTPRWVFASYVQSTTSCYILNANITVPFSPFDTDAHVFRGVVGTENNTPFWSAYLDGARKSGANLTLTERWEANTLSIYIGARNNNGTAGNFLIGDIYYHKVTKAGVLIQHLVAAKRDSDSVLGMYDLVSGTFFTNAGTGSLTAGAADYSHAHVGAVGTPEVLTVGILPSGYTLVDRVWNAATTVATTNVKDNVDDVEYEIRVKPNAGSWYIFQSRASANAYIYGISGSSSGNTITFVYGLPTGLTSGIGSRNPNHIYLIRASHKNGVATLYVKDETTGDEDTKTATYNTADYVASQVSARFWGNSQNTINAGNYIYHAKMWKRGELVLDCVPVTYGNEAGLYDYVSGSFIGATQGTLTAGDPVPTPTQTASVVNLFAVGSYADTQEIISGLVTRKIGVLVLDGTETWTKASSYNVFSTPVGEARSVSERYFALSTHFVSTNETNAAMPSNSVKATDLSSAYAVSIKSATIGSIEDWKAFLASEYAAGTPVIVVYPLDTPTTESATPQELTLAKDTNVIIAIANVSNIEFAATYMQTQ